MANASVTPAVVETVVVELVDSEYTQEEPLFL